MRAMAWCAGYRPPLARSLDEMEPPSHPRHERLHSGIDNVHPGSTTWRQLHLTSHHHHEREHPPTAARVARHHPWVPL